MTPTGPSYRPPWTTESRWEPASTAGPSRSPDSRPKMLPAAVHVHLEAGPVHQVDQQLTGPQLVDREDQPRDRAALAQTDAGDRVEVAQQPVFIDLGDFHMPARRSEEGRIVTGNGGRKQRLAKAPRPC